MEVVVQQRGHVERYETEQITYAKWCWRCKTTILSEKTRTVRMVNDGPEEEIISSGWMGAPKCQRPGCKYFRCPSCKKCLCDSPYYTDPANQEEPRLIVKRWVQTG